MAASQDSPITGPFPFEADRLLQFLVTLGISATTHQHPPVFTVEESQAIRGLLPGGHCKNLLLRDRKHRLWLLVCRENLTLDLKSLRAPLGAISSLSFASPEVLREVLGVTPGAVTPFGLINDRARRVTPVIDTALLTYQTLYFHPLRNDRSTAISPQDLKDFIAACGHTPLELDLEEVPAKRVEIPHAPPR
ncbi:MAG: prolyl-tRNA synthetase associated domain-containing protein [Alphaproteobacteria bacterium]